MTLRPGALLVVCAALLAGPRSRAQVAPDTARCDSIVAAARVDSVPATVFVAATRIDGPDLSESQREKLLSTIIASFRPPVPFRLTVFGGGVQMRALRPRDSGGHRYARARAAARRRLDDR